MWSQKLSTIGEGSRRELGPIFNAGVSIDRGSIDEVNNLSFKGAMVSTFSEWKGSASRKKVVGLTMDVEASLVRCNDANFRQSAAALCVKDVWYDTAFHSLCVMIGLHLKACYASAVGFLGASVQR